MVVNINSLLFQVVCGKVKMVPVIGQSSLYFVSLMWHCKMPFGVQTPLKAFPAGEKDPLVDYWCVEVFPCGSWPQMPKPYCTKYPADKLKRWNQLVISSVFQHSVYYFKKMMQYNSKVHLMQLFLMFKMTKPVPFFLISNIHRGSSGFFMFVCVQNVSVAVWVLCLSVCTCLCACRCVLKPTEGSHAHGSVTWIFCFASGCCGLPRYGEPCSWGWGWWSGRGTLSNGLPRDLTPLSRDTWAPYIAACSLCQNAHFLRYSFSNLLTPNSNPHPIRLSRPTS